MLDAATLAQKIETTFIHNERHNQTFDSSLDSHRLRPDASWLHLRAARRDTAVSPFFSLFLFSRRAPLGAVDVEGTNDPPTFFWTS